MSTSPIYWQWQNVLDLKQIKKINKFIINNYDTLEEDKLKAVDNNNVIKKNLDTFIIKYKKVKNLIFNLVQSCYEINKLNFGYNLWDYENSYCNYNIYRSSNESNYGWHIDRSFNSCSDTKLTVIINLSEKKFEGGDFLLEETNLIKVDELKEIGSMIMFKSYTRHMVTPVTSGERKNLTLFLTGPNFI